MSSMLSHLLLILPTLGAPAPQAPAVVDGLVERLPEDTVAIIVGDLPKIAKSAVGKRFVDYFQSLPAEQPWLDFGKFAKDIEVAVVGQYAIDKFAGDFCFFLKLRDGSDIPKTLERFAQGEPVEVGSHKVYPLVKSPAVHFAVVDKNTIAIVLLNSDVQGDAVKKELEAVFGLKKKGPSEKLRKLVKAFNPEHAIAVASEHPKSDYSAALMSVPFVAADLGKVEDFKGTVVRYHGGIVAGDKADVKFIVEFRDEASAEGVLKAVTDARAKARDDPKKTAIIKAIAITRDKNKIKLEGTLTREILDIVLAKQ
jgi:hypothetical protein